MKKPKKITYHYHIIEHNVLGPEFEKCKTDDSFHQNSVKPDYYMAHTDKNVDLLK